MINLYGTAHIADALGVSRGAVSNWLKRYADCPEPFGMMADRPIAIQLDLSAWTRLAEVVTYADQHCNGDTPEAIKRLVNTGLSHQ